MNIKWSKIDNPKTIPSGPHVYKIINLSTKKIKTIGKDTGKKPRRVTEHMYEAARLCYGDPFEIYVMHFDTKREAEDMERLLHLELLDGIKCSDGIKSSDVWKDEKLTKDIKRIRKETTIYDYSNHNMFPFSVGDTLKYIPDKKIEVRIKYLGKNKINVIYQSKIFSLSKLDRKLQNIPYFRQGTQYFEFKGKAITEYQ